MGASGHLCAAVLVFVDENTKATGVVTANVSSDSPPGPARVSERGMRCGA